MSRRILFLVASDYDTLRQKGVERLILDRDEGGFFERVVTVHPLAFHDRIVDLNATHRIYEFSAGRAANPPTISGLVTLPLRLAALVPRLLRIVREERIDLIRATDAYVMGLLAWIASRAVGIPYCVSIHADYEKCFTLTETSRVQRFRRSIVGWIPRFVIRRADLVLPIREHLVRWIEDAGAKRGTIEIIPHGIDMVPFTEPLQIDARAVFGVPAHAKIVSFVGRMSGDNYASDIAEVVERVVGRRRDVVFVLVGEGSEEPHVRRRLLGLGDSVRILPFQPYETVVALRRISTASLCLMGGFSLIEACAAGSPVVAYDVEWHRELVRDGITGFVVRENDVDAVVAALERLIDDPVSASTMGQHAQRLAFARHDLAVASKTKQDCYTKLLNGRQPLAR